MHWFLSWFAILVATPALAQNQPSHKKDRIVCANVPPVVITPRGGGFLGIPYIMIGKKACREAEADVIPSESAPSSLPQVAGIDTNKLSYNALDRALGREPRDRAGQIDPSVCFEDAPPVGWEAIPGPQRLVVQNNTDSALEIKVFTHRGETKVETAVGFVGFPEFEGYHLPTLVEGHGSVLPPHTTCYTRLPTNRSGVWSVQAEQLVHSGDFGEWVQDGESFTYSVPLVADGSQKTYGVRDRGQRQSLIVFRASVFRTP
ncbi:MAG: hypothetical protein ABH846_01315 [Patescibacteria group bacterium]